MGYENYRTWPDPAGRARGDYAPPCCDNDCPDCETDRTADLIMRDTGTRYLYDDSDTKTKSSVEQRPEHDYGDTYR